MGAEEIMRRELRDEIDAMSEKEIQEIRDTITEEERERIEREQREQEKALEKANKKIEEADTEKAFLEAIAEALEVAFGEDATEDLLIESPDDDRNPSSTWHLVWEGGSPFEWAVDMTMKESWFGIEGYQDNEKFYLEPYWSFSLGVGRK